MNRSRRTLCKQLIIAAVILMTGSVIGQKETKTIQERFIVADDAVLDINISYADIEFETWNKNEVAISATITLEGASKEEAEAYFNNSPFEILGNSKIVSITSRSRNNSFVTNDKLNFDFDQDNLRMELPEIASFVANMPQIAPFPNMPPLPISEASSFDYEAYRKDGDNYMKKWQKNFEKSFDKDHQKRLEEWASKMEGQAEEMEKRMDEQHKQREKRMEERVKLMEQRSEERVERSEKLQNRLDAHRQWINAPRSTNNAPTMFYYSSDGEQKNYKVKKTIKIKLPKSTSIKMNVRHGEVKLAENTKNLNANLSHSSLLAATIDGQETNVIASYSPVHVQKWNYGQLSTSYSEEILLSEVVQLQLQATSSKVTIDRLLENAFVKNNFGAVRINELGTGFKELDVSLKNGELSLSLPKVAAQVYVKGNSSSLKFPKDLKLVQSNNGATTISKGFHLEKNSGRSIVITSDYSEVVIH